MSESGQRPGTVIQRLNESFSPGTGSSPGEDGTANHARSWHHETVETVLAAFETGREGLSGEESARRKERYGANRLPRAAQRGPVKRFFAQFHNLLIYVLLAAALASGAMGHLTDSAVILTVIAVNAVIGFIQEGRAEDAIAAIRAMVDPKALVLRAGRRMTVPAEDIVPGDIVLLESGDRVPADLRLLRTRNLSVDEAVLTGESVAVDKAVAPVPYDAAVGDRRSMAFSGTFVASGRGEGVVVATAQATQLGQITALIQSVETLKTPLLVRMDRFARHLTVAILALAVGVFFFAFALRGYGVAEAFMAIVGMAVAAIPEGLPAVMTVTLAIGVRRMAGRNAIIRRLPAVETLGSVSVIGSDKTGTLTANEMTVQTVVTAHECLHVTGAGYDPKGGFRVDDREIDPAGHGLLQEIALAALLCNDAELTPSEASSTWTVNGDPMEGALVTLAVKAGLEAEFTRKALPRDDEIPFESEHQFMASLHHSHEDGHFVTIKGAPERLLEMCSKQRTSSGDHPLDPALWHRQAESLAANGQRVLAVAVKPLPKSAHELTFEDVRDGAVMLGLLGLIDPPRQEVYAAVRDCRTAGIRIKMITGDHAVTAQAIAAQLELDDNPAVVTSKDLAGLDEDALSALAERTTVFARTSPEDKLKLVKALQSGGAIVAMTGDGVNDAPALKRADVGVAMGRKGTEAAKESAEMVLTDDNFASIVAAVSEGRTVYDNLKKVIAWTLPTNGGETFTIVAAILFGLTLPITPIQLLWINMITAVTLGLTLAFEPSEAGTMKRPPRPPSEPVLTGELLWRVIFVSFLFVVGAFGMFNWAEDRGSEIETTRTIVVNTIVALEIFYLFAIRYAHGTSLTLEGVLGTPAVLTGIAVVLIAQAIFTYVPFIQAIFETRPLSLLELTVIASVGVALLLVLEMEKAIRRRLTPTRRATPQ